MSTNLPQAIEAILFATATPQSHAGLAKQLGVSVDEVREALRTLATSLEDHGIALTDINEEASLVTRGEHTALIEAIRKEELSKDLSKASAETLAVIAYIPGTTKSQIEFIRGVNVSYSLRALMMRGLVESKGNGRAITYHPTHELLNHYGVSSIDGLPAYAETKAKLEALLSSHA